MTGMNNVMHKSGNETTPTEVAMIEAAMIEEQGTVIAIEGRYAVIEIQARSACGHCTAGDSCGTSVLASLFSKRRNRVRLINHLDLSQGDTAVVGINESVLLTTAVLAYMLPLILMITLAVTADLSGLSDDINFAFSLLGLFAGMLITNRIMGNKDYEAREIVLLRNANDRIINEPNANEPNTNELRIPFVVKQIN
jgi:sigma-E factor negative regulatory protein RseC